MNSGFYKITTQIFLTILLLAGKVQAQGFYFESMRPDFNQVVSESMMSSEDSLLISFYELTGGKDLFADSYRPAERIVGGQDADIEDYPWHVALLNSAGSQVCGGTILSANWILTAAHCSTPHRIRAGVTNRTDGSGQDRFVLQKINHPNYLGSPNWFNDIALVQLTSPLDFSDPKVQPIPIITQAHANDGYTDRGVLSVITGWGALWWAGPSTNTLQVAEVPLVANEDAYTYGWYNPTRITADMICAGVLPDGGIDACQGDSGGPLVVPDPGSPLGFSVAGVTSWGSGCAFPNFPGVYSRVSHNESWLASVTGLSWNGPSTPLNPTEFEAVALDQNSILLTWERNTNDDEVLLLVSEDHEIGAPINGELYNLGDPIPGGGSVLYAGTAGSFEHTGIEPGGRRYYKIFSKTAADDYSIGRATTAVSDCYVFYSLPFIETFEENSPSLNCWSQIRETGTRFWSFGKGAGFGTINNAYAGERNARFSSSPSPAKTTKLVSPVLNLSNYEDLKLSFWFGQENWAGDQNTLSLFYRTGPAEPWVQIGSVYSSNVSSWTQVQDINLPNPSSRYQIAFEATDNYGRANVLDDIEVTGTWIGPPTTLALQNILLENEDDECYAATEHVYVAGGGTTFVVEEGASAIISAGNSIHFFDGTKVKSSGYLHARIDMNGDFCINHESLLSSRVLAFNADICNSEDKNTSVTIRNNTLLHIFPNPSTGLVNFEISGPAESASYQLEIYNLMGKMVYTAIMPDAQKHLVNLDYLQKGLYLVKVTAGKSAVSSRFILH